MKLKDLGLNLAYFETSSTWDYGEYKLLSSDIQNFGARQADGTIDLTIAQRILDVQASKALKVIKRDIDTKRILTIFSWADLANTRFTEDDGLKQVMEGQLSGMITDGNKEIKQDSSYSGSGVDAATGPSGYLSSTDRIYKATEDTWYDLQLNKYDVEYDEDANTYSLVDKADATVKQVIATVTISDAQRNDLATLIKNDPAFIAATKGADGKDGINGADGANGSDGISFVAKGTLANEAAVKAVVNPSLNDAYVTQDNDELFIYNGTDWVSMGTFKGHKGEGFEWLSDLYTDLNDFENNAPDYTVVRYNLNKDGSNNNEEFTLLVKTPSGVKQINTWEEVFKYYKLSVSDDGDIITFTSNRSDFELRLQGQGDHYISIRKGGGEAWVRWKDMLGDGAFSLKSIADALVLLEEHTEDIANILAVTISNTEAIANNKEEIDANKLEIDSNKAKITAVETKSTVNENNISSNTVNINAINNKGLSIPHYNDNAERDTHIPSPVDGDVCFVGADGAYIFNIYEGTGWVEKFTSTHSVSTYDDTAIRALIAGKQDTLSKTLTLHYDDGSTETIKVG